MTMAIIIPPQHPAQHKPIINPPATLRTSHSFYDFPQALSMQHVNSHFFSSHLQFSSDPHVLIFIQHPYLHVYGSHKEKLTAINNENTAMYNI